MVLQKIPSNSIMYSATYYYNRLKKFSQQKFTLADLKFFCTQYIQVIHPLLIQGLSLSTLEIALS